MWGFFPLIIYLWGYLASYFPFWKENSMVGKQLVRDFILIEIHLLALFPPKDSRKPSFSIKKNYCMFSLCGFNMSGSGKSMIPYSFYFLFHPACIV